MMDPEQPFRVDIIVANDKNRGIGLNGTLPWSIPAETNYYHGMINHVSSPDKQNAVIFGRITFQSIRDAHDYEKLLKVVVTREAASTQPTDRNLHYVPTFQAATEYLQIERERERRNIETVWVLGGSRIYDEALRSPYLHRVYLTTVQGEFACDTHFPEFDRTHFGIVNDPRVPVGVQTDNGISFQVEVLERKSDQAAPPNIDLLV
ncbi:hypothetical protein RvY_13380 [Ramazzottius varieornatus]|uniref:dihydrofolate reductase n=1 Tax=Ramazzottius varieornatus TaxID=947166 RepID=A0A1D1VT04_RAMVA|nr:hypothetical protein RvY_13380 [Ramazzottius varieornatus]